MKLTHINNPQQTPRILFLKPNRKSNVDFSVNNNEFDQPSMYTKTKVHSSRPSFHQPGTQSNNFPSFLITTHSGTALENLSTSVVKELKNEQNSVQTNFKIQNLQSRVANLQRKMIQRNWNMELFSKKIVSFQEEIFQNKSKMEQINSTLELYQENQIHSAENLERKIQNITSKLLKYRSQLQFQSLKFNMPSFSYIQTDLIDSKIPYKIEQNNISVLTETIRLQFDQIKKDIQRQFLQITTEYQNKRSSSSSIERISNETIDESVQSQTLQNEKHTTAQIKKKIATKITPFIRNQKNSLKKNEENKLLQKLSQFHNIYHMDAQGYLLDQHQRYLVNDEGTKIKLNQKSLKLLESLNVLERQT